MYLTRSYDELEVEKLPQTFKVGFMRTTHNKPQESTSKLRKTVSISESYPHSATPNAFLRASAPSQHSRLVKPTFLPLPSYQQDKITAKRSSIRPPELYFQSNPRPPPPQPIRVAIYAMISYRSLLNLQ